MVVVLQVQWKSYCKTLSLLAFQSFGVVYGDLSTSPLYVYRNSLSGRLNGHLHETTIFGLFSLIFWTITLVPLLKYVLIVLSADDNGEGKLSNCNIFCYWWILELPTCFAGFLNVHACCWSKLLSCRWNICFVLTPLQACKIQSAAKPASGRWRAVDILSARHWSPCCFLSIQKVSGEAQEVADLFTSFCSIWCMHGDRRWCPYTNYIWYAVLVSLLCFVMQCMLLCCDI